MLRGRPPLGLVVWCRRHLQGLVVGAGSLVEGGGELDSVVVVVVGGGVDSVDVDGAGADSVVGGGVEVVVFVVVGVDVVVDPPLELAPSDIHHPPLSDIQ